MKAIVYTQYGPPDVLKVKELEKPVPGDLEILVKVHATTVTSGDWRARSLDLPPGFGPLGRVMFGIRGPRQPILGTELAGEVEAVGEKVAKFNPGDKVFAYSGASMGSYAQYKCIAEDGAVEHKPQNPSYEEAAALSFGGTTALHFFRKAELKSGETVLINGASGGVGTAAVQLAKHFGAEVTGVCSSANTELVKSLGAKHVIDYNKEDFIQNDKTYDVIMDTAGTAPYSKSKTSLKEGGRLLLVLGGFGDMLRVPWVSMTSGRKIIAGPAEERPEDLHYLAELAEAGEFKPVIDRSYPFEKMVEAHRYVDNGHKKGNVVITVA
ncbi:NAD(P)-dependent alcohol dehydrogenase [Aliifodinibius sp. S!AR15-10]|uniref:NAD(P)-dependent alcohol dehydrogenase n=1 Tax=Aliifodinibius sp. S!AR15-10 TaxID=2950437 RepID=UPI002867201D|nr:NAD(P)-dependent alcohol dehydrogenase [Aliifodinibius sp. S!AR15-10]MDR8393928.1 NAD(P)-dependent alcohol dehydrogenase [Aliifodinibius sp. S!AR15-10]